MSYSRDPVQVLYLLLLPRCWCRWVPGTHHSSPSVQPENIKWIFIQIFTHMTQMSPVDPHTCVLTIWSPSTPRRDWSRVVFFSSSLQKHGWRLTERIQTNFTTYNNKRVLLDAVTCACWGYRNRAMNEWIFTWDWTHGKWWMDKQVNFGHFLQWESMVAHRTQW